ncbi:MAG TPA: four helix bundle protein [Candidatus Uhrbacteria bacterium]|nr:four helix bundle protein [Candidatus Uhrbacteria bacterium]
MYEGGYKKLIVYKNACELRRLIYKYTDSFKKEDPRLVSQMRNAARSVKQNIVEGYKRDSIGIYINMCKVSYASLEELIEDIDDCFEDERFNSEIYDQLNDLAKRTSYLLSRYINSLFKMEREGTWRKNFK